MTTNTTNLDESRMLESHFYHQSHPECDGECAESLQSLLVGPTDDEHEREMSALIAQGLNAWHAIRSREHGLAISRGIARAKQRRLAESRIGTTKSAEPKSARGAISYIRVASVRQLSDGDTNANSLTKQRQRIQQTAARLGTPIAEEFVDHGNSTGGSASRPALRAMLAFVERNVGKVDRLIVISRSRIFRNRRDATEFENRLASLGIELICAEAQVGEAAEDQRHPAGAADAATESARTKQRRLAEAVSTIDRADD